MPIRKKIVDTSTSISKAGRADLYARSHSQKKQKHISSVSDSKGASEIDAIAIITKYNLKGFEFGNWMSNDDRYDNLVATESSLVRLAWIFNSQNIGFNQMIGIAFGARGVGRALAHYEPQFNMINLTKEKGAGCLAHEYGHAIDYNFGRYIDQHKTYSSLSGGIASGRKPLIDNVGSSLRALVNEIVDYPFTLERVNWEGYWAERTEVFARMFEEYVAYRISTTSSRNTYLARSFESYQKNSKYLTVAEFKPLIPKFNALVKLMGTILNSKGKVPMPLVPYPIPKAAANTKEKSTKDTKNLAAAKDVSTTATIVISGSRSLAAEAVFCFENFSSHKNEKRGTASTLFLNYPTEGKAREEFNKGIKYLISRYPNYKVDKVKHTGKLEVFYVTNPTNNGRISIYQDLPNGKTSKSVPTAVQGKLFARKAKK